MDDEDLEEAVVRERYEFDCPYCGGVTDLRDIQPSTGDIEECEDCCERVRIA